MAEPDAEAGGASAPTPGDGRDYDPTRASDINYYRQSALATRLSLEASRRARKARRDVMLLLPLAVALVLVWRFREDLFGTDVPVRVAAAVLLSIVGWRLARDLGRAVGPRLMRHSDPGTASTVGFVVQLVTVLVVVVFALRVVDLEPRAIALGGAVTAVVLGLAAQSTLGNVIAGVVLVTSKPFRVGERVRLQGGPLGGEIEGTVASLGLIYTTLARGQERVLVPNNAVLGASIVPLRQPAGVDLRARLQEGVKPSDLQRMLAQGIRTPTRDAPHIALDEVYADGAIVRITATPVVDEDGARLADEVVTVVSKVASPIPVPR